MSTAQIVTYDRNPLVSDYVRRRNHHIDLAERGIAHAGVVRTHDNVIVWRVDAVGNYHESTVV